MEDYIAMTFSYLLCFEYSSGSFRPAYIKKSTLEDDVQYSRLKELMRLNRIKIIHSVNGYYMDQPLMLDVLLFN